MHVLKVLAAAAGAAGVALSALGQAAREPHIAYIYPAGGQQGTTFEVVVGGQNLEGVKAALLHGTGVQATVVKYIKPLAQQDFNAIKNGYERMQFLEQAAKTNAASKREADAIRRRLEERLRLAGIEGGLNLRVIQEYRRKSTDGKRQLNPALSEMAYLKVTVAPDARDGARDLRLVTPGGRSNPLAFQVDRWAEYRETEPNDRTADSGAKDKLPVVLNGQIMPGDVDRFRINARKGQRLAVVVSARDLIPYLADAVPGWFQATLSLTDEKGHEVAYVDDFRFSPDPAVLVEIPADGFYVLEIKDSIFRGREDFVYRVTVGEVPVVTGVFPMGGTAGTATEVALDGWNLPKPAVQLDLKGREAGLLPVRSGGAVEAVRAAAFVVDTLPSCPEKEPNNAADRAQRVKLPTVVDGRIGAAGDLDVFRFDAKAGDTIVAEVQARRLGSPLDSRLVLTDAGGRQVAMNDDFEDKGAGLITHQADSRLQATLKEAGSYTLSLCDAQGQGGEDYGYRLRLSPPRPDFELRVTPSCVNARPGETVPFTVFALRHDGFSGDIRIGLRDAPSGFAVGGGWIPAGQDKARLTLSVPSTVSGAVRRLVLEGRATIAGAEVVHSAVPAEDLMQAFFYRHLVPAQDDWQVALVGEGRWRPAIRLQAQGPVRLAAGGVTSVRYGAPYFASRGQIQLELSEPPEGIGIEKTTSDRDGVSVQLRVDPEKAKPGLKGNLIVEAFMERAPESKDAKSKAQPPRRFSVGFLPAIPFEIVAQKT